MSWLSSFTQLSEVLNCLVENTNENPETIWARGITTDSRQIEPGQVFLALRGENFDGHDFVHRAVEQGAAGLIIEQLSSVSLPKNIPLFRVDDTLAAYQKIAQWWRLQLSIPIIAVTGSVGKTTTKEMIAGVLSTQGQVHKTTANYNNEIGVPKTLLGLDSSHQYAVVELAMRARGEIAQLTQVTRPTVGVITNVGTAHIERLGSEEAIAAAKCELLEEMDKSSIAILNQDQPLLRRTAQRVWQGKTLTYGLEGGDIHGKFFPPNRLEVEGLVFSLPFAGRHHALNFLAALAVARVLGVDWQPLTQGLKIELPEGRAKRYTIPGDIVILDETYNAGLESMLAALDLLAQTPAQRRIAVLGAMKELGDRAEDFHQRVGKRAEELGLDALWVLVDDPQAAAILTGAKGVQQASFSTLEELISHLHHSLGGGDCLLFKASHSVGFNRAVQALLGAQ